MVSLAATAVVEDALPELLPTGARRLIEAAVAVEFEECLRGSPTDNCRTDDSGWFATVTFRCREILTGSGAVAVEVPELRSRSGSTVPFRSSLVPPYIRRSNEEYRSWCRRSLADDWVYVWAGGIRSGLRGAANGCAYWW